MSAVQRFSLVAGVVGGLCCLLAFFIDRGHFFQSYLFAYVFALGVSLGSMAISMLHRLTGGDWGYAIQHELLAAAGALPLLAILFVPLLSGLPVLYAWARPDAPRHFYLNEPFFFARVVVYFAIWLGLSHLLRRRSAHPLDPDRLRPLQHLCAGGLLLYGLTASFFGYDLLMSLTPGWHSTTFGFLVTTGQMLSAMAFAICAAAWGRRNTATGPEQFHDLGNLLLMFIMTWAYLAFTQYLVIWFENLPKDIAWYLPRTQTSWQLVGLLLILFHFAVPFCVLLSRRAKRARAVLATLAAAVLLVHLIDVFWLATPGFRPSGLAFYWTDFAAVFAVGGLWLAEFIRRRRRLPVMLAGEAHA